MVVVGTSCCGKTTFALRLADRLGCPHVELDALHWGPDWIERPLDAFRSATAEAVAGERWVVDGNYHTVRDLVWPRATHVIWLDYSFPVVFWRALRRTISRSLTGEDLYSGNRETLARAFWSRDSILLWVLTTFHRRRRLYRELMRDGMPPSARWTALQRPTEAERFLRSIPPAIPAASTSPIE